MEMNQLKRPLQPSVLEGVVLVFLRHSGSVYRRLSMNLVREIVAFFTPSPILVHLSFRSVTGFDVKKKCWRQLFQSDFAAPEMVGAVLLSLTKVFACGGYRLGGVAHEVLSAAWELRDVLTVDCQQMQEARFAHGVVHCPALQSVFVFGGMNVKMLRSGERFSLETSTWRSVCDLHTPRACFNPVLHEQRVFLCGGNTKSVETFDPVRNSSVTIGEFVLPESGPCTAFVAEDSLIVVTSHFTCWWSLRQTIITKMTQHKAWRQWTTSQPVVCESTAYFLTLGRVDCHAFDITDDELLTISS